jgi:antitoxin component of RelBE/YafQ-DinJ toxin-antitoxin module
MKTTTLHIPIDKNVRDKLEAKAKHLGFDSVQAYIRVWAKAEADNRVLSFDEDDWGEPSDAATKRLNKAAKDAKKGVNVSKPFYDTKSALDYLHNL